jgi:hypothetical protein
VLALLLSAAIVRNAAVDALSDENPAKAATFWRRHPAAQLSQGMIAIAAAAHKGVPVDSVVLRSMYDAGRKDALAPEPFLVRGIQAQLAGNGAMARKAFTAAKRRDPRSLPARYFLANDAVMRGDESAALREIAVLARLAPTGAASLAPFLARYALDRANWPSMRTMFHSNPGLAEATFVDLAREPANADVILALADERQRSPGSRWVPPLLASLVAEGAFAKARQIWAATSHVSLGSETLVFDPDFKRPDAPPPFNWSLTSSTIGLAERERGGGLHAIYYGQEDGALASQLLVLPPGAYRLKMRSNADALSLQSLRWRLFCATSNAEIATAALREVSVRGLAFRVSPACKAQRIELFGTSAEMPQQADVTITGLTLTRERAGG